MIYYIFGAHSRARTVKEYLRLLEPDMCLAAYLFDNEEENPAAVDGIPVICLSQGCDSALDTSCPVYIGTRGIFHPHIIQELQKIGFSDIRPVTVELDIEMRNAYVQAVFAEQGLSFRKLAVDTNDTQCVQNDFRLDLPCGTDESRTKESQATGSACIYVAKSAVDKPLHEAYTPAPGERILQVGASLSEPLTDAAFVDNTGENISELNRQFCELTGLYWIWKNAAEDIVGLCHYRRHFLLPDNWAEEVQEKGIDILLPVPLYVAPSLAENYRERHIAKIWETMMAVLAEQNPKETEEAESFFENNGLYCPCNMLIARKEVFKRLSAWLFPIIFETQKRIGTIDDAYQNRYPGFLSERLISFWCYEHREEYSIWFADKNFLV